MDGIKWWKVLLVGFVLALAWIPVWGELLWPSAEEATTLEPTISPPSAVTFPLPTGLLTCAYTESAMYCLPTWYLIPTWMTSDEAKTLYGAAREGAVNGN